jgi:hypothetical protein
LAVQKKFTNSPLGEVEQINFQKMLATLTEQDIVATIQSNIVQNKHRHTKKLEPAGLRPYQSAQKRN